MCTRVRASPESTWPLEIVEESILRNFPKPEFIEIIFPLGIQRKSAFSTTFVLEDSEDTFFSDLYPGGEEDATALIAAVVEEDSAFENT